MKKTLKRPVISEKSKELLDKQNKYVFLVAKGTNKIIIAQEIEHLYNVKVVKVNIAKNKGKSVRRGRITGKTPDRIKAIVTLKKGDEIEKYKESF